VVTAGPPPAQNTADAGNTLIVGVICTVTTIDAVMLHTPFEPVTEYVVVVVGLIDMVLVVAPPGVHA
jgi:hypothetical protein